MQKVDRALLASCLSTATQIVANTGKMINMAHHGAKDIVVDAAFTLYEELEEEIVKREAAEKALEEAAFAQHAAERAEAERAPSEDAQAAEREAVGRAASKAEQASVEDAQAAASGLSAAGEGGV